MTGPAPQRVRVTSPRRDAARRRPGERPGTTEIDEGTGLGRIYMQTYLRGHRRLLLAVLGTLATLLLALPVLVAALAAALPPTQPAITAVWLLVGALAYPGLWLLARGFTRGAERLERDFGRALERESGRIRHQDHP